ncbi:universal stress protein [Nocardia vinacea]|uniref:universal stress protein n=1 Tax=Nocardia vinacea TaxID=96468 RepID=UPI0033F0AB88
MATATARTAGQSILAEQPAGWQQEKYPDVQVIREAYLPGPTRVVEVRAAPRTRQPGSNGFRGLLLGSTSNALLQTAHCPAVVVHPQ